VDAFIETRRPRILDLLKRGGPSNVPALARVLGINPTAVRQQIAVLQREGLVQAQTERRGVGRPTFVYSLTEKAEKLFPQAYAPMALAFLRLLRRTQGESAVDRFFSLRARDLASAYRRRLQGLSAPQKLQELARIREEEGYMASSGAESLTEHHCPISAIAAEFPQACRVEHRLFEQVLGRRLRRVEHIASGDRACVYRHAARSDGS